MSCLYVSLHSFIDLIGCNYLQKKNTYYKSILEYINQMKIAKFQGLSASAILLSLFFGQ